MKQIRKNLEIFIASISFAMMLLVVIANVLSRIFFSKSFGFTEEISYLFFTYSVFFGAAHLFKNHALIAIDFIVEKLPPKIQRISLIINFLTVFLASIYLLYLSAILTIDGWVRPTSFLGIPYTFIYLAAFLAFSIMALYSLKFLITLLRGKNVSTFVSPENQF